MRGDWLVVVRALRVQIAAALLGYFVAAVLQVLARLCPVCLLAGRDPHVEQGFGLVIGTGGGLVLETLVDRPREGIAASFSLGVFLAYALLPWPTVQARLFGRQTPPVSARQGSLDEWNAARVKAGLSPIRSPGVTGTAVGADGQVTAGSVTLPKEAKG